VFHAEPKQPLGNGINKPNLPASSLKAPHQISINIKDHDITQVS
jgi:hypothetical protein